MSDSSGDCSGAEGEGLCEYERRRLENIQRNQEMLKTLGKVELTWARPLHSVLGY